MTDNSISLDHINILNQKLGSGYISEVFLGIHKYNRKKYAIKIIDLKRVTK